MRRPLRTPAFSRGDIANLHLSCCQPQRDCLGFSPHPTLLGLDCLSAANGILADSQQLAAQAFGADRSWFLVNGCTAGIQAAIMACAGPGDTLLVARNCHLSVVSGMVLSGEPRRIRAKQLQLQLQVQQR